MHKNQNSARTTTGRQTATQPELQELPIPKAKLHWWQLGYTIGMRNGDELRFIGASRCAGKSWFSTQRVLQYWEDAKDRRLEGHRAIIQAIRTLWPR